MTKTLRISGGDFTTFAAWLTYLHTAYTSTPMSADEVLKVQAGQVFALPNTCDVVNFSVNTVLTNGFKIIIQTDTADSIATLGPGFLDAGSSFTGMVFKINDTTGALNVELDGIGFSYQGVPTQNFGENAFIKAGSAGAAVITVKTTNSFFLWRASTGAGSDPKGPRFIISAGTLGVITVENCMFLLWGYTLQSSQTSDLQLQGDVSANFSNNVILTGADMGAGYSEFDVNFNVPGPNIGHNNTLEAYFTGASSLTLIGGPVSDSGNISGAIGYGTALIQSITEAMATVRSRVLAGNAKLLGAETNVIDDGDNANASDHDYVGTARPQGTTVDRGPFELISAGTTTTSTTSSSTSSSSTSSSSSSSSSTYSTLSTTSSSSTTTMPPDFEVKKSKIKKLKDGRMNIGSASEPEPSAALQITSVQEGLLLPRMTTVQRNLIPTPIKDGLMIYNILTNKIQARQNGAWVDLA